MTEIKERINLGDRAKDVVSGWEGVVCSRHEYLNGCVRFMIEGADKDGKPEGFVFDEQQVVVIEHNAVTPIRAPELTSTETVPPPARTGGPRDRSAPSAVGH